MQDPVCGPCFMLLSLLVQVTHLACSAPASPSGLLRHSGRAEGLPSVSSPLKVGEWVGRCEGASGWCTRVEDEVHSLYAYG
jgi:hypothetical protein